MAKRLSAKFSRNTDWRGHPPFTEETRHELLQYVTSWKPSELVQKAYGRKTFRLLIFGPSGHGKSSFISSIKSCLDGEIGQGAVVGEGMAQVSRQYNEHPMIYKGEDLPFVLCDSRGLHEEGQGAGIDGIRQIITGQFQQGEIMPTHQEMMIDLPMPFKATDLPLGIIFVVDVSKSEMLRAKLSFNLYLEKIIDFLNDNEIPRCVVVTHTDTVVTSDLKTTFSNQDLEKAVESSGKLFRVAKNSVYPVKCYTDETETKKKVDILLLCALKGVLIAARHRAEYIARSNTRSQIRDHGFGPRRASYI